MGFAGRNEAIPRVAGDCFVANGAPRNDRPEVKMHLSAFAYLTNGRVVL